MFVCFDWYCDVCDHRTEYYVDRREPDWDRERSCEACGNPDAYKVMSAPEIRTDDNAASYLDGTKQRGMEDLKKAAKLEVQKLQHRPGSPERAAISKEIAERKRIR